MLYISIQSNLLRAVLTSEYRSECRRLPIHRPVKVRVLFWRHGLRHTWVGVEKVIHDIKEVDLVQEGMWWLVLYRILVSQFISADFLLFCVPGRGSRWRVSDQGEFPFLWWRGRPLGEERALPHVRAGMEGDSGGRLKYGVISAWLHVFQRWSCNLDIHD